MPTDPDFPPVILTIDCVLLTLLDEAPGGLAVALQVRANAPFEGVPALPGGYVHAQEDADLEATARRVLRQKLGLGGEGFFLEQLCTVSGAGRDPRGWSASVVYYALVPRERLGRSATEGIGVTPLPDTPQDPSTAPASPALPAWTTRSRQASPRGGGDGPSGLQLVPIDALPPLAFDHAAIVEKAAARLRAKTGYSNLPGFLLPATFTMPELIAVYERVLGQPLDQSVFRRRMDELGLIAPVADAFRKGGRHRPAQLYRLSDRDASLHDRVVAQKPRKAPRSG